MRWKRRPDEALRARDTERHLRWLLAEAGVDLASPTNPDIAAALAAFREFASQRVRDVASSDPEGDMLLAQFGTYNWGEGEHFELDLTRQFTFSDRAGEYSHMTQLHCTFEFPKTDVLSDLGSGNLWSAGLALDDFFGQVEALPGFAHVLAAGLTPLRVRIDYEQV